MLRRPRFGAEAAAAVLAKSDCRCHHCGTPLDVECRRAWHVDHWPVRFADMHDQLSCCGLWVTDPTDPSNLVASCAACNTSHRHERRRWCGRSQLPCKRRWAHCLLAWLSGAVLGGGGLLLAAQEAACEPA